MYELPLTEKEHASLLEVVSSPGVICKGHMMGLTFLRKRDGKTVHVAHPLDCAIRGAMWTADLLPLHVDNCWARHVCHYADDLDGSAPEAVLEVGFPGKGSHAPRGPTHDAAGNPNLYLNEDFSSFAPNTLFLKAAARFAADIVVHEDLYDPSEAHFRLCELGWELLGDLTWS